MGYHKPRAEILSREVDTSKGASVLVTIKSVYWRVPISMLCAMIVAISAALGHHAFYKHLSNTKAPTANYKLAGLSVSQQQINLAIGTAFAFLVKACLVIAYGLAYTQLVWKELRRNKASISTFDTLVAASGNILTIFSSSLWRKPLLLIMAVQIWLIPLATVVSPVTLSITFAPITTVDERRMPSIAFDSLKFFTPKTMDFGINNEPQDTATIYYGEPCPELQKLAQTVAMSGSISSMNLKGNITWQNSFYGPYLSCNGLNSTFEQAVKKNIAKVPTPYGWPYMAWTPGGIFNQMNNTYVQSGSMPFPTVLGMSFFTDPLGPMDFPSEAISAATIYFAVMPNMEASDFVTENFENSTFLECKLYNTLYQANFSFTDGTQSVELEFPELTQAQPVSALNNFTVSPQEPCFNGSSVMSGSESGHSCVRNPSVMRVTSYQSIMDAFGRIFVGYVSVNTPAYENGTAINSPYHTSILSTSLVNTKELAFISGSNVILQNVLNQSADSITDQFGSLMDWNTLSPVETLQDAVEKLFQNITISLLSSAYFYPNESSPLQPDPVAVTTLTYTNIYSYSAGVLWLAYGLVIGSTCIALCLGYAAIYTSGATFSQQFSTILRATYHAQLSEQIKLEDDGRDPLPEELAHASVQLRSV